MGIIVIFACWPCILWPYLKHLLAIEVFLCVFSSDNYVWFEQGKIKGKQFLSTLNTVTPDVWFFSPHWPITWHQLGIWQFSCPTIQFWHKLMPERCYQNPGSCSWGRSMNFANTQAASKQRLYYRKANSSQDRLGGGRRVTPNPPPPPLCTIGGFIP